MHQALIKTQQIFEQENSTILPDLLLPFSPGPQLETKVIFPVVTRETMTASRQCCTLYVAWRGKRETIRFGRGLIHDTFVSARSYSGRRSHFGIDIARSGGKTAGNDF